MVCTRSHPARRIRQAAGRGRAATRPLGHRRRGSPIVEREGAGKRGRPRNGTAPAIAIDSGRRLLWLAVFENASASATARVLAEHGTGRVSSRRRTLDDPMVLGAKAAGARSGTLLHSLPRPVATFFGVKADPL